MSSKVPHANAVSAGHPTSNSHSPAGTATPITKARTVTISPLGWALIDHGEAKGCDGPVLVSEPGVRAWCTVCREAITVEGGAS